MEFKETAINDCFLLKPKILRDERGFFMESFNQQTFYQGTGLNINFVQDNMSQSSYGVLRGLHAQRGDSSQAKLVQVVHGEVLDVVIDYRKNSPTFKNIVTQKLSSEIKNQIFVPRGCFHGFAVLSEKAIFSYKCDNFYNGEADFGIAHNDPEFNIDWIIPTKSRVLSDKDKNLPLFKDVIF